MPISINLDIKLLCFPGKEVGRVLSSFAGFNLNLFHHKSEGNLKNQFMYIFFDSIKPETVHYLFSQAVNILKALGSLNFVENLFLPDYVL